MKTVAVVGSQWGDEGKGKVIDYLATQADVVIRGQVLQPGIEPVMPALGSWSLNYWAARKVPCLFIGKDRHLDYPVTILPLPSILQAFNNFLKNNQNNKHSKILCLFF